MPESTLTSPYVDSNTCTMGNLMQAASVDLSPMPESTSSPVRDLGFGLQRDPSRDLNLLCTRHYFLFIKFIPRLKAIKIYTLCQCCWSASHWYRSGSWFLSWCRSGSEWASKRYRTSCGSVPKFYTCSKIRRKFLTLIHSFASLKCFIFLTSVKNIIIFCILTGKKWSLSTFHLLWIDIIICTVAFAWSRAWSPNNNKKHFKIITSINKNHAVSKSDSGLSTCGKDPDLVGSETFCRIRISVNHCKSVAGHTRNKLIFFPYFTI